MDVPADMDEIRVIKDWAGFICTLKECAFPVIFAVEIHAVGCHYASHDGRQTLVCEGVDK